MFLHITPGKEKCEVRLLNNPPKKIYPGYVEYIEWGDYESKMEALKKEMRGKGLPVEVVWSSFNSSVYVLRLRSEVKDTKKMMESNAVIPDKEPLGYLYVGMTNLPIDQRVKNHLSGYKSCNLVKKYFQEVWRERCETGLSYERATERESELAEELRGQGYWVYQK